MKKGRFDLIVLIVLSMIFMTLLSSCGQSGRLYLPEQAESSAAR